MGNNLYMRLNLAGGELDQVEYMRGQTRWGRTHHGSKPVATLKLLLGLVINVKVLEALAEAI